MESLNGKHADEPDSLVFPLTLTESFEVLWITGFYLCLVHDAQESAGHVHYFVNVLEHSLQMGQRGLQRTESLCDHG